MRRIIHIILILCFGCVLVVTAGCGDNLSESKARELIQMVKKDTPVTLTIFGVYGKPGIFTFNNKLTAQVQLIERLVNEGYFTVWHKPAPQISSMGLPMFDMGPSIAYQLTDKSKALLVHVPKSSMDVNAVLKLADFDRTEINGITKPAEMMGKKICTVEYTAFYKANHLGEILLNNQQVSQKMQAEFVLYENGWRIVQ